MTEPLNRGHLRLRPFYEYGQAAGQRGEPLDACRYRRADRRNAWVRGWHAGNDQRVQLEAFRAERGEVGAIEEQGEA